MSERLKVLRMLDQGTITVERANQLLEATQHDLGKPGTDPILVDVDVADQRVQIYLG